MVEAIPNRPRNIDDVLSRLTGVKKQGAGYQADCPVPGHETPQDHFSVTDAGDKVLVRCHGRGHSYEEICAALGFEALSYSANGGKSVATAKLNDSEAIDLLKRIYGLSDDTLKFFGIKPDYKKQAWKYPVKGGTRYKKYSRKPPSKYFHSKGTSNQFYRLEDILPDTKEIWLPNGEPAKWVMWQANIPAICGIYGEGQLPENAVQLLKEKGVQTINIPCDLDTPGKEAAIKDYHALKDAFKVRIRQLSSELGEHGDVCDLYKWCGADNDAFKRALEILPEVDLAVFESEVRQGTAQDKGAGNDGHRDKKRPSVATQLVELAGDLELVHSADGTLYAVMERDGHIETWPLARRAIRDYLARRYYEETSGAPHSQALQDALNVLRSRALFDGHEELVYVRLAAHDGKLYLDLCDAAWQVVEIDAAGWRVVSNPPVRFRRSRGMVALPMPRPGGDTGKLKDFLNVANADWPLLLGWLIGAFMPVGPYPILVLTGEQGSAKSTVAKVLRSLVDPSTVSLRSPPRDESDLAITASNSWVVALDNVSNLPAWLSDAICRLATGGGFATRELYTDAEEMLFAATRPVVLNGIGDVATRSDLLDRAIIVTLPAIPDEKRRTEAELWRELEQMRPRVLGALLNAVSVALSKIEAVNLPAVPRMADFAKWVVTAAPSLGIGPKDFLDAYTENRQSIHELALESSLVAAEILALASKLSDGSEWIGTATELLEKLNARAGDAAQRRTGWPKNARALGGILNRLAPNLRAVGVNVMRDREGNRRFICVRKGMQSSVISVTCVTPGTNEVNFHDANPEVMTQSPPLVAPTRARYDDNDDNDAKIPTHSNTIDPREAVLGMPVDKVIEIWRSQGASVIHLGPSENSGINLPELDILLSRSDVPEKHLFAVRRWLDKVGARQ